MEGEDYKCGVFTVPQNWDEPGGPNLDLAFIRDPGAELDLSCLDARKPKWALPDGSVASQ